MCWALVAEEPHRSTILNLKHCPLKANARCLIFPLHQGKTSSVQPLSGLDFPSQGSRGQLTGMPSCHSPLLFPPLQQEKQRARISPEPPLAPICCSLVAPPWSAINRPFLKFPVAITVLAVALDVFMLGLSATSWRSTARYTSGLLDDDLSRWIHRRHSICISSLPTSPTCK
jgi:hypothetical protein